jgi:hypothetical protein
MALFILYLKSILKTIFNNGSMFSVSVFVSKDVSWVSITKINIYSFLLLGVWTLKFFARTERNSKLMQNLKCSTVKKIKKEAEKS